MRALFHGRSSEDASHLYRIFREKKCSDGKTRRPYKSFTYADLSNTQKDKLYEWGDSLPPVELYNALCDLELIKSNPSLRARETNLLVHMYIHPLLPQEYPNILKNIQVFESEEGKTFREHLRIHLESPESPLTQSSVSTSNASTTNPTSTATSSSTASISASSLIPDIESNCRAVYWKKSYENEFIHDEHAIHVGIIFLPYASFVAAVFTHNTSIDYIYLKQTILAYKQYFIHNIAACDECKCRVSLGFVALSDSHREYNATLVQLTLLYFILLHLLYLT